MPTSISRAPALRCWRPILRFLARSSARSFRVCSCRTATLRGVQGIGFSERVRGPDVPSFLRGIRREGAPQFRIWPSAQQAEYFPVVFLEPSDARSSKAIGFDLAANAILRAAMEWSRDSGRVSVSRRVDEQEPFHGAVPSVLLLAPVYRLRTQLASYRGSPTRACWFCVQSRAFDSGYCMQSA